MKFGELRRVLDVYYVTLDTPDGRFDEFNTRSGKYDDLEVCTIQHVYGRVDFFIALR